MCLKNDGIEDTEHFLLQCHVYSEQRRDLLGAIKCFNYITSQVCQIILLCELCCMVMKDLRITRIDKS